MTLRNRLGSLQTAVVCRGQSVPVAIDRPRLRTPADVLALLEHMTAAVQRDPFAGMATKARAVGHLAAVALKAMEANNLAARVELLEAVLKQRQSGSGS